MIDVMYLSWNRREFVEQTFPVMLANTNWDLVRALIVYDDGSTDGAREYLDGAVREAKKALPCDVRLSFLGYGSPVATMNHYLSVDPAELFAKIDCDIACPPGWLDVLNDVMEGSPELELLGMQAGMTGETEGEYRYEPSSHIGGVGLMRSSAFLHRDRLNADGRFGFTQWQHRHEPVRGWICPDLLCPQLDLIPVEPYVSWSERYIDEGWQRRWSRMSLASVPHHSQWFIDQVAAL